jgi:hypothetical protein
MTLKFSSKRQIVDDQWSAFGNVPALPAGAQSLASAPTTGATPVQVLARDAKGNVAAKWALYHRDGWRELEPFKDFRDGSVTWRMNGTTIGQPIAWLPRKK